MKTMMMAALAVAALLAGCSSSSDDASTDSSDLQDVAAWNSAVTYTSCIEQDVSFPIPMADASAGLPEGFAPVAFDEQGQTSMVLIWTDRCFSGELAGEDVASPGEMWGFLPVVPPAAFLDDSVQGYLLAYGAMVSDPAVAAMYHAWGLSEQNVTVGNVSIGTLASGLPPLRASVASGSDGSFSIEAVVTSTGLVETMGGGTLRAFFTSGSEVVGAFDNTYTSYTAMSVEGPSVVAIEGDPTAPLGLPVFPSPGLGSTLSGIGYENRFVPTYDLVHDVAVESAAGSGGMRVKSVF